jgi:redox-sensitive bicupin YhaK (pirin superfamily)
MKQGLRAFKTVELVRKAEPTMEGAGVRLMRAFGGADPRLDPFLMLDDFHSDDPRDYQAGFPSHPHRGMETVTYMVSGSMTHGDSLGNKGTIGPGEVQWMTAGSGIIHGEMPVNTKGRLQGFQLWISLPSADKMMQPRYQNLSRDMIPTARVSDDVEIKIIAGKIDGAEGPVRDLVVPVEMLDVKMTPNAEFAHAIHEGFNSFAYVYEGEAAFGSEDRRAGENNLVVFGPGDEVRARSVGDEARFLLVSGRPVGEPVAWRGPVVMNTDEQLAQAFRELREGSFVKHKPR